MNLQLTDGGLAEDLFPDDFHQWQDGIDRASQLNDSNNSTNQDESGIHILNQLDDSKMPEKNWEVEKYSVSEWKDSIKSSHQWDDSKMPLRQWDGSNIPLHQWKDSMSKPVVWMAVELLNDCNSSPSMEADVVGLIIKFCYYF